MVRIPHRRLIGCRIVARVGGVAAVIALSTGCAGDVPDDGDRAEFSVRDSAGIAIAESAVPAWTEETAWRLEPEPSLVIGSRDGDPPGTDFGRVGRAVRLSDGRIVVADVLARELRVFDADGSFEMAVGGRGGGPAEFQRLGRIGVLRGDSIVARDAGAYKTVVFGPDGELGRTVSGPRLLWNDLSGVSVHGWLADGSFVVADYPQSDDLPPGRSVAEREWHYFDAEGEYVGEVTRLPVYEANNEGVGRGTIVFGPNGLARTAPDGFWHAFPRTFELRFYSPDGLERIVRRAWEPESVPDAAKASHRSWFEELVAGDMTPATPAEIRRLYEARIEQMTYAETLPAFSNFLVARDGHLWVRGYASPEALAEPDREWGGINGSDEWTVFSPEGRWLGSLVIPGELRVREIGADYVLAVRTDELDVPYVVLHRIVRSGESAS